MSKDKENVPKLRFPGFSGAWEKRKFAEVFNLSVLNNNLSRANLMYEQGEIKNIHYGDILVKFDSIVDVNTEIVPFVRDGTIENYRNELLINGDIIIADTAEDKTTGKAIEVIGIQDNYVVSGLHTIVARPNKHFAPSYLGYYINSVAYRNQLLPFMQGIKVLSLSKSNLSRTKVSYPADTAEQEKIGLLFHYLDNLITLHKSKLNNLQQLKAGLLQKMFPKEDEDFPEVRFPQFTDAWRQRSLGKLAEFSKGNGYIKSDLRESGSPIVLYGRLYTKYETVINDVDTFVEMKDKSVISEGNEVIVPASGETAEDISRASVIGKAGLILGGDLNIIKPKQEINSIFLALTISNGRQQKEMSQRAQGKSVVHLRNSDLRQVNLIYPKLEEQAKICELFTNLDHLINLHQRKLDHLQQQKKALLQQMFV